MSENIIKDFATRTNGEVYIGVVGSVRSGKSTFIRRFMERKVLPLVSENEIFQKILDELPQSSDGKTIMTVEPKFVPSNQISVSCDGLSFNVRLVDCVGYVIPSSKGYLNDDGTNRMVKTPWYEEEISFSEAASIGTKKVIDAHSNVGIVITSDGSFGEFTESEYDEVLENVVGELQNADKPFVIVLNTLYPNSDKSLNKKIELEEQYGVSVIPLNVDQMTEEEIDLLLKVALNEFKISELSMEVPTWVTNLDANITFKKEFDELMSNIKSHNKMKDAFLLQNILTETNLFESVDIIEINPSNGIVTIDLKISDEVYNSCIEEILGEKLDDKSKLISILQQYKENNSFYEKFNESFKILESQGYAMALPSVDEMHLDEPELSKQSGRYGIKIRATAPAVYMVKVEVESCFEPIIGSKEQAEALVEHMSKENVDNLWNSEIFGRKLCDVINDGIKSKVLAVPDIVQYKYKDAINKVVNKTKGGVIAIVL